MCKVSSLQNAIYFPLSLKKNILMLPMGTHTIHNDHLNEGNMEKIEDLKYETSNSLTISRAHRL